MISYVKIFRLEPECPKPSVRGLKPKGKTELEGIGIKTGVKQGNRKVVGLVNNGAKYDRMEQRTGSTRLIGYDKHISRHPHQGMLVKISLIMETFEKNKNQRIREPARQRQHADDLEQREEENQGFQNRCENDCVQGFAGIHAPATEVSSGEPMDPRRQAEAKKRYEKGKQEALQKDPEIGITLVLSVGLLYPVAPPSKDRKRTEFKLRIFVT